MNSGKENPKRNKEEIGMKMIMGGAGSGKTNRIIELANELDRDTKALIVVGGEHPSRYFNNVKGPRTDIHYLREYSEDILVELLDKFAPREYDIILLDVPTSYSVGTLDHLRTLQTNIVLTIQTNKRRG